MNTYSQIYHLALYLKSQNRDYYFLPELIQILGDKSLAFFKVFGGLEITIPTLEEVQEIIRCFEIIEYKITNNIDRWSEVKQKFNLTDDQVFNLKEKYKEIKESIKELVENICV